ncbi:hypothetical protein ZIOFF_027852 [Zingiber officinale]|uniref:Cystatin domain-containing protein n=1 Tax=Zingiber officinale TaxID=94328 RepID=A0A8J5L337_ZINOF|nr:hypothetical protein ZIOFF_027852 [Zingiber officinale]
MNALLEFARVVKAREQVVAGTLHHLTVEAVEGGEKKLYEPKVWVKTWLNFKQVEEFKHVGEQAVMLEQASYCYLLSIPPMLRKYGFHLVLSGNRYYISDQRQHAIRAYRNALFVIEKMVGVIYLIMFTTMLEVLDLAIKHMLEVLACSHLSLATQNVFLNEFSHVVQSMGMKFEVYNLRLLVINMASLKDYCYYMFSWFLVMVIPHPLSFMYFLLL